ncbi:unnamed protein product [Didymodactylos carnosus]|uniref:Uncharacterized protein n=1 Tax=Didymodactylos carnosus TaxID=1234261 RepID=A0A815GB72_9BILA|nr:unnamed protein product [Didymodactylos carnosus]CAF1336541.1 unnamed protein product [Didymodactylos carnosus]CAF3610713.1 unnamed protein product [Didymodactylos carnosus]CAF4194067.1 unnamed protein product [Didymodactylos carnosus]
MGECGEGIYKLIDPYRWIKISMYFPQFSCNEASVTVTSPPYLEREEMTVQKELLAQRINSAGSAGRRLIVLCRDQRIAAYLAIRYSGLNNRFGLGLFSDNRVIVVATDYLLTQLIDDNDESFVFY